MATQIAVTAGQAPPIPLSLVAAEQVVHIPLSDVRLSKTNPRKSINEERLAELAADIQQRGVQEPILVRPVVDDESKFEIIYGERRYRASREAGKTFIPAIVRVLSDDEAYEIQVFNLSIVRKQIPVDLCSGHVVCMQIT